MCRLYMELMEHPVTRHYKRASVAFEYDYVRCPTLFYCSKDDPVAIYRIINRVAQRWECHGNYVRVITAHVQDVGGVVKNVFL